MNLDVFKGENKDELSMIEVAHAILKQRGETIPFADLVNEIQNYLGKSDEEIRDRLSQFYTDLNVDGSFISLGDNVWGLRSWYPFDSVDEAVNHGDEDDEDRPRRKKRKKVNAFLADVDSDDDVIDYNDDDPEDDDFDDDDDEDDADDDTDAAPDKFVKDVPADDDADDDDDTDDSLTDGIEGQLQEFSDDDDDTDDSTDNGPDFSADDDSASDDSDDDDDDDDSSKAK